MTPPDAKPLDALRTEAVAAAYFAREMAAPDTARARAERSYTIAGAIGATLLGAGVIGGIGGRSTLVAVLGVVALALWAAAAGAFVHAVGSPVKRMLPKGDVTRAEFATRAIDLARTEEQTIVERYERARNVAATAVLMTLAALIAAVAQPDVKRDARTLFLTERGQATLARTCGTIDRTGSGVHALVDLASLEQSYVILRPTDCPEMSIARADVLALSR